ATATGLPRSSIATNVKYAEDVCATSPARGLSTQTFTPTSMEVWKTRFTLDLRMSNCPMYRMQERYLVDCRRHDRPARVPDGSQPAAQVDQMHHPSAQHISELVRIVRKRNIGVLRLRFPHWPPDGIWSIHDYVLSGWGRLRSTAV